MQHWAKQLNHLEVEAVDALASTYFIPGVDEPVDQRHTMKFFMEEAERDRGKAMALHRAYSQERKQLLAEAMIKDDEVRRAVLLAYKHSMGQTDALMEQFAELDPKWAVELKRNKQKKKPVGKDVQ